MTINWSAETHGNGAYADINGLHMYYETHGTGRPMILLHGGLGVGRDVRADPANARRGPPGHPPGPPGARPHRRHRPPDRHRG